MIGLGKIKEILGHIWYIVTMITHIVIMESFLQGPQTL